MNFPMVCVVFLSAFLSFIYELAIAQTMAFLTADAFVWYAIAGGIFLGFMGLGVVWSASSGISRSPIRSLILLDCLQALVGGTTIILLYSSYSMTIILGGQNPVLASGVVLFSVAFLGAAAVGLLAGAGLSLLMEIGRGGAIPSVRIPIVFYFGTFVAGVVFPLVFLSYASASQIALGAGLLSALVALYLSWKIRDERDLRPAIVSTVLAMVLGILLWQAPAIEISLAQKYYSPVQGKASWKDLFLPSGPQASLYRYYAGQQQMDVVRFPSGGEEVLGELISAYRLDSASSSRPLAGWGLFINGTPRFSADFEDVYFETFAHVPVVALGATPERVLILGGGNGLLARELLRLPSMKEIVVVNDGAMMKVFREDPLLRSIQNSSLKDPRVRVIEADAYNFIRRDQKVYDAIYLDFPDPLDYDGSKVFSLEFLYFVKVRLAQQGFMVIAATGFPQEDGTSLSLDMDLASRSIFLATISAAGFKTVVPFFSRLEEDNPAALAVMRRLSGGQEDQDKEMLRDYVSNLASGFLLAIPRSGAVLQKEFSSPISFHILNALRFRLSLDAPVSLEISESGVNSIFHSQLPRPGSWWKIRSPY